MTLQKSKTHRGSGFLKVLPGRHTVGSTLSVGEDGGSVDVVSESLVGKSGDTVSEVDGVRVKNTFLDTRNGAQRASTDQFQIPHFESAPGGLIALQKEISKDSLLDEVEETTTVASSHNNKQKEQNGSAAETAATGKNAGGKNDASGTGNATGNDCDNDPSSRYSISCQTEFAVGTGDSSCIELVGRNTFNGLDAGMRNGKDEIFGKKEDGRSSDTEDDKDKAVSVSTSEEKQSNEGSKATKSSSTSSKKKTDRSDAETSPETSSGSSTSDRIVYRMENPEKKP